MARSAALLLIGVVAVRAPAIAQARVAINLNTHSEVTIDRPAAAIWSHIVDPSAWKQGAKLSHHAGPAGQVGETFAAREPADESNVAFFVENVELVPNHRRTIKIFLPTGALVGFATWTLWERGGRTVVGYEVYSESLIEPARAQSMTPVQLQEAERASMATNQKRFDQELLALKRLIETGR